tara:strand:- start:2062 stop:2310 length:249 start_codon:yes stop_codon:yes gene_type:complete
MPPIGENFNNRASFSPAIRVACAGNIHHFGGVTDMIAAPSPPHSMGRVTAEGGGGALAAAPTLIVGNASSARALVPRTDSLK